MKNLYIIKTFLLLVLIILSSKIALSQTDMEGTFTAFPETKYDYKYSHSGTLRWEWTIGNGYFVDVNGNPLTPSNRATTETVYVKWLNDNPVGNLLVSAYKYQDVPNGIESRLITIKNILPPNITSPIDIAYSNSYTFITIPFVQNATKYDCEVPSGWGKEADPVNINRFKITPLPSLQPCVIKCRAGGGDYWSPFVNLNVTRSLPAIQILDNPPIYCGAITPVTYSVTPNLINATYTWSLPPGWSGPTTTSTNTISVIPNGMNVGTLSVDVQVTDGNITQNANTSKDLNFETNLPTLSFSSPNGDGNYYVTGGSAVAYYVWRTTGGVLINGQPSPITTTSNNVTLTYSQQAGQKIFVSYVNNCGQTEPEIMMQLGNVIISGPSQIYTGQTGAFLSSECYGVGPLTYNWYLQARQPTPPGVGFNPEIVGNGISLGLQCGTLGRLPSNMIQRNTPSPNIPIGQSYYYDLWLEIIDANGNIFSSGSLQISTNGALINAFPKSAKISGVFSDNLEKEEKINNTQVNENVLLNIFPNPAEDHLYINLPVISEETIVKIFSMDGKLVLSQYLHSNGSLIKIDKLKKGFYVLKLSTKVKDYTMEFIKK